MSSTKRKSRKDKLKTASADVPSASGAGVCELLVEDGLVYKDTIVCFVDEVLKDRSPGKLFRLKTVNSKGAVIFFIRYDNLYLVGFEIVGGKRYEFGREGDKHLIANSTFLEYDGSYRELEEVLLVNIRTDYSALNEAVNKLLEGKDREDKTNWMNGIKKYLATTIVMFPETARFRWVFVTLVRLMDLGQSCPPTCVKPWMPKMIHSWGNMSVIAAGSKEDGTNPPVDKDHEYTADDVDKALEFCNWANDALVVHSLIMVPVETLRRKRTQRNWWVSVKLADSAGNEEKIWEEWSSVKKRFPNYDDGYRYN